MYPIHGNKLVGPGGGPGRKRKLPPLTEEQRRFVHLFAMWITQPDDVSFTEQKELRKLAQIYFPDKGRADIARKPVYRGIAVGFKDSYPIIDFLNDKPFKLNRANKRRLFESWSNTAVMAEHFMGNTWGWQKKARHPMGILFSHKFKPKEIILHLASDYIDKDLGKALDMTIDDYSGGDFLSRKEEDEILTDSYKANIITRCKNVPKFSLRWKTLNEDDLYTTLMSKLDSFSQQEFEDRIKFMRPDEFIIFSCHGKKLSIQD